MYWPAKTSVRIACHTGSARTSASAGTPAATNRSSAHASAMSPSSTAAATP